MNDDALRTSLHQAGYIADETLTTTLWLAGELQRPLMLEGDAGVGKTALAAALARARGQQLVRLQCYEGLDLSQAAYEWNYGRQLLAIRLHETQPDRMEEADLFARDYLLERPLLQAISSDGPCVLLIDEIDRADEPFEAFLLELLSDFQVSIPEFGTVRAQVIPLVIMTSNRTREVHDALKRRCLYQWIGYPNRARELQIVAQRAPEAAARLQQRAVDFVHRLRGIDLFKAPGIVEAIDWCRALAALNVTELDPQSVQDTLGVLLKYQDDLARVDMPTIEQLLAAPALPE